MSEWWTAVAIADAVGVTDRQVRQAARTGRLGALARKRTDSIIEYWEVHEVLADRAAWADVVGPPGRNPTPPAGASELRELVLEMIARVEEPQVWAELVKVARAGRTSSPQAVDRFSRAWTAAVEAGLEYEDLLPRYRRVIHLYRAERGGEGPDVVD